MTEQESRAKRIVKAAQTTGVNVLRALADDMPARSEPSTGDHLSERLVQAANEAIAKAEGDPTGNYDDCAIPAVVAVLQVLEVDNWHLRSDDGFFTCNPRHIADEIEQGR